LLLIDFAKPVLLANVLVWPFAFVAADHYLEAFTERIGLTPVPFLLTFAATLAIAWIMIGTHVMHASNMRPAEALRHE
jgi:putative ABC transport system permease protein